MITKSTLKQQIEHLPEEFTIDELVERLILIEKIERGYQQSERGNYVSESDLDNDIEKWFK
jgi:Zn-dependent alcohol dehydrogenase